MARQQPHLFFVPLFFGAFVLVFFFYGVHYPKPFFFQKCTVVPIAHEYQMEMSRWEGRGGVESQRSLQTCKVAAEERAIP